MSRTQLDIQGLLNAIKIAIDANSSLVLLHDKISLGTFKEAASRPYGNANIVGDRSDGLFGGGSLNYVPVEFSVYSDSQQQSNELCKAIGGLLDGNILTLSGQRMLRAKRSVNNKVRQEGRSGKGDRVYKSTITIEFIIQV